MRVESYQWQARLWGPHFLELLVIKVAILGVIYGLYRDNGKEHGNYCFGFRVLVVERITRVCIFDVSTFTPLLPSAPARRMPKKEAGPFFALLRWVGITVQ